jgi:hypothetical protein
MNLTGKFFRLLIPAIIVLIKLYNSAQIFASTHAQVGCAQGIIIFVAIYGKFVTGYSCKQGKQFRTSFMSKRKATGLMIGVRCQDDLLTELDNWRWRQIVVPSRAAAIRRLAEIGMQQLRLDGQTARATAHFGCGS